MVPKFKFLAVFLTLLIAACVSLAPAMASDTPPLELAASIDQHETMTQHATTAAPEVACSLACSSCLRADSSHALKAKHQAESKRRGKRLARGARRGLVATGRGAVLAGKGVIGLGRLVLPPYGCRN